MVVVLIFSEDQPECSSQCKWNDEIKKKNDSRFHISKRICWFIALCRETLHNIVEGLDNSNIRLCTWGTRMARVANEC